MQYLIKKTSGLIVLMTLIFGRPAVAQTDSIDYYKNTPNRSVIPTADSTIAKGEMLFRGQCAECHRFDRKETGPALSCVTDRRPVSWLLAWIDDSQSVVENGDEYAQYLFKSYDGELMPPFDYLSDEDKLSILAYIQKKSHKGSK